MTTLFRDNWPLGWTPNSDASNADPRGLLRADNLTYDEDGVLSLIRGTKIISNIQFSSLVSQIYSCQLDLSYKNGAKLRYVVVNPNNQSVIRNYGGSHGENVFDYTILTGGADAGVGFGAGFGHVFITAGIKKFKDSGDTLTPLGMGAPNDPGVTPQVPPYCLLSPSSTDLTDDDYTKWEKIEGGSTFNATANYLEMTSHATSFRAVSMRGLTNPFFIDATGMNGVASTETDDDQFYINVRIGDTSKFVRIQVTVMLDAPTTPGFVSDYQNYFEKDWNIADEGVSFTAGINAWTTLTCKRSDFSFVGSDDAKSWHNVFGVRVTFVDTVGTINYVFNGMKFLGGVNGPLSGDYSYIQVDVQDNTFYVEKSLPGIPSGEVHLLKTYSRVSPTTSNAYANECWIFRKGGTLNQYYRVKRLTGALGFTGAAFNDTVSDEAALEENIVLDIYQSNLPDGVMGIETNFKGRNWYITYEDVYPSYRDNLSSYDTRYKLEIAARKVEYNLFITKLTNDVLILATNRDFYTISGTGGVIVQNDVEFFDINIQPMGIKTPAISKTFAVREGNLFYFAADGVRVLSGSNCLLLTDPIDLLFRGLNRYQIAPVSIVSNLAEYYYIGVSKGRLFFSTAQTDNRRALYIYEFDKKIWRYEDHGDGDSISALWVEQDDTVIYSTALFGDRYLRQLDVGTKADEVGNINFHLLTIMDCNSQPRNRKDSFTLKIVADSGGKNVMINLYSFTGADRHDSMNLSRLHQEVVVFTGKQELYFNISDVGLAKYYQIDITGATDFFKLYNFSIDYDPRPDQLNYLRVPAQNYGVAGRKRIYEIPFVIDTLGNNIQYFPIFDGIVQNPGVFNTSSKTLVNYIIAEEQTAVNIGGYFTGELFEFYEFIQPKEIEVLPDPLRYRFIPYTNLGTGSRKRFIQYAIVIDTRSVDIIMTPIIDGVPCAPQIIRTARKQTVIYTFDFYAIGVDVACTLSTTFGTGGPPFEFYEVNLSECVSEKLPPISSHMHIPYTNFNTSSRKRVSQFAFVIDTRGIPVTFTPMVDGVAYITQSYITNRKETVIYTFDTPVVGIDIGGTLEANGDFEYYGPNLDDTVYEKLPPKVQAYTIPCTNYGSAAKKRIRTIPFMIDTFGSIVTYTPSVDGILYPASTHVTNGKRTVLHYFEHSHNPDGVPFGIDYCGVLTGTNDFEFYGLLPPENVETLPVGKKYDQFGPIDFNKIGKIREISIRLVPTGTALGYHIFASDSLIITGNIITEPNFERNYVIGVPKGVNPNIFRMEIYSDNVFYRFYSELRVNVDGAVSENKRITIDQNGHLKK